MGAIKDSVAWRSEWHERFQSVDFENQDELLAFFEWWMNGITFAILATLESFPPDDERLPRYLASLKPRWLIRDLRLCKKAGGSMDLARHIARTKRFALEFTLSEPEGAGPISFDTILVKPLRRIWHQHGQDPRAQI